MRVDGCRLELAVSPCPDGWAHLRQLGPCPEYVFAIPSGINSESRWARVSGGRDEQPEIPGLVNIESLEKIKNLGPARGKYPYSEQKSRQQRLYSSGSGVRGKFRHSPLHIAGPLVPMKQKL